MQHFFIFAFVIITTSLQYTLAKRLRLRDSLHDLSFHTIAENVAAERTRKGRTGKPEKNDETQQEHERKRKTQKQSEENKEQPQQNWDEAVRAIRDGITEIEDALDLIGATGAKESISQLSTVLAFLEGRRMLLGEGDEDGDSDAWQADIEEHQEAYAEVLETLKDLMGHEGHPDESVATASQLAPVLEQQLEELPLEDVREKVEAFTDAAATLQKLRDVCNGDGDVSEHVYARLWRLGEAFMRAAEQATTQRSLQSARKQLPKEAYRALLASAHEAVIEKQAQSAKITLEWTLCPAARNAARDILLGTHTGDPEEDHNERLAFLLSILNSPTAPVKCQELYRQTDVTSTTCICDPGECSTDPLKTKGTSQPFKWACASCKSRKCSRFWQKTQCEQATGCEEDTLAVTTVLGSRFATQSLLRRGLYIDPQCKGVTDCLRRTIGESWWQRLKGIGNTIYKVRHDYLAIAALASVGAKLLTYASDSGGAGKSLVEQNSSFMHTKEVHAIEIDVEKIKEFVGLLKPALLSYLWIRLRVQEVRERASSRGFCRRAARELSLMARAPKSETNLYENVEGDAQEAAEGDTIVAQDEAHATELSEVLVGAVPNTCGGHCRIVQEDRNIAKLKPVMRDALSRARMGGYGVFPFMYYPGYGSGLMGYHMLPGMRGTYGYIGHNYKHVFENMNSPESSGRDELQDRESTLEEVD